MRAVREALTEWFNGLDPDFLLKQETKHAAYEAMLAAVSRSPDSPGREETIRECAEIAQKYDDCGGSFIAEKILALALPPKDGSTVTRPNCGAGQ